MAAKISLGQINSAFASVAIKDESGQALAIGPSGELTVGATDFDIRDLLHTQDSVKVGDGINFISLTGNGEVKVVSTDLDIRDLNQTQDSIRLGDGTNFLSLHADGSLKIGDGVEQLAINAGGSINAVVSATDLDIRDLSHNFDSVKIGDGSEFLAINADGSINLGTNVLDVNLTGFTVSDFDIRDLSHGIDSVKVGDGVDFLAINADGSINVNGSFGSGSSAWQNSKVSLVAATAAELAAIPLSGRTSMTVQNLGNQDVFLGPDNTVTDSGATQGLVLPKGTSMDIPLTDTANIWAYSAGAVDLMVSEFN